jgi:hypothetical protein
MLFVKLYRRPQLIQLTPNQGWMITAQGLLKILSVQHVIHHRELHMTTIFSNPRVATLNRPLKVGREKWIIVATTPINGFTALHELDQGDSVPSVVEQITIQSRWELEVFRADLVGHGWT